MLPELGNPIFPGTAQAESLRPMAAAWYLTKKAKRLARRAIVIRRSKNQLSEQGRLESRCFRGAGWWRWLERRRWRSVGLSRRHGCLLNQPPQSPATPDSKLPLSTFKQNFEVTYYVCIKFRTFIAFKPSDNVSAEFLSTL